MDQPTALRAPRSHMEYSLDAGVGARANIGLIALASDRSLESEWRYLLAIPGVAFHTTRIPAATKGGPQGLEELLEHIEPAAQLLVPDTALDVVAFGCTSAAGAIGEERIFAALQKACPVARPTTPITAALAGFKRLGVGRIAMVTPYGEVTNAMEEGYLRHAGLEICRIATFGEVPDDAAGRIDAPSVCRAVVEAAEAMEAEAVFVSCTSLRCAKLIPALEAAVGRPVVSSNQAMAWHAIRLAGIDETLPQFGRLFGV